MKNDYSAEFYSVIEKHGYKKAFHLLKKEWDAKKQEKPSNLDVIVDDWFFQLKTIMKQLYDGDESMASMHAVKYMEIYNSIRVFAIINDLTIENAVMHAPDSIKILLTNPHNLSDCEFWRMLGDAYMMATNSIEVLQILKNVFVSDTRKDKNCLMTEEELQFLNSLPDEIRIHRGMDLEEAKSENYGASWSLSKKVAEFFAFKYLVTDEDKKQRTVVSLTIPKKEVIAYFNRRNEEEIIWVNQ
jgi:hypothetical protein